MFVLGRFIFEKKKRIDRKREREREGVEMGERI